MLSLERISVASHKAAAVKSIFMNVKEGRIVMPIGANGAGQSTTLRAIPGQKHRASGDIWFDGRPVDSLPPREDQ